jgi:hypothetical protein
MIMTTYRIIAKSTNHRNIVRMKYIIVLLLLSILYPLRPAMAQEKEQHGNVVIIAEFVPTISDATKVLMSPQVKDSPLPAPKISYTIDSKRHETKFNVETIKPATLKGDSINKLYKHHFKAGFGNYTTPLFQYAFNSGRSTNLSYGFFARHLSSGGEFENYGFPGLSENIAQAYLRKSSQRHLWSIDADFKRDVCHLYGFKTDTMSVIPDKEDYRQRFTNIKLETGMALLTGMKSLWRYDMNLGYENFSDRHGSMEQNAELRVRMDKSVKWPAFAHNPAIFIHGIGNFYHNKYDKLGSFGSGLVRIKPGISGAIGPMRLRIGVNAVIDSDSLTNMNFYPLLDLSLDLIPNILVLNAMLTGDATRSSYKLFAQENPFVHPAIITGFTTEKVHFTGGLRTGFSRNLNINIAFSTSEYSNYPLFMPDTMAPLQNNFKVVYDNMRLLNIKAEVLYQKSQKLRIGLKGNFYDYSADMQSEAWYKPQFDARLSAMYNLYNRIIVTADFNVIGERPAPYYEQNAVANAWEMKTTTLKPFYDLSLGLEYRYTKMLSGFLMINNLTSGRYQQWYNYPSHRFNMMLGLTYAL